VSPEYTRKQSEFSDSFPSAFHLLSCLKKSFEKVALDLISRAQRLPDFSTRRSISNLLLTLQKYIYSSSYLIQVFKIIGILELASIGGVFTSRLLKFYNKAATESNVT
jgi:hypothetical protein